MKCPVCGRDNPDDAKFCCQCAGHITETAPAERHITFRAAVGERRTVTVLIGDLKGFSSLAEKQDPEEVHRMMDNLFADLAAIVKQHGGVVDKFMGDAVMAVFGIPEAHEDDPVRAVNCAIEMQEKLKLFKVLQMRIGINTGECHWGSLAGGAATVMGDAVTVVKRLETRAMPGRILVSLATKKLTEEHFAFHMLPTTRVKGREELVQPYEVASRREIDLRYRKVTGLQARMIGRDCELAALEQIFRLVRDEKRLRLVIIAGEAGVGKSRRLYEFINRLAERSEAARLERGRCIPYGASSFWPLAEIMRNTYGLDESKDKEAHFLTEMTTELAKLDRHNEIERTNFAHALGIAVLGLEYKSARVRALDQTQFHEAVEVAFRIWLEAMASGAPADVPQASSLPFVMTIEDLHWADEATLEMLAQTMRLLRDVPLMVICPMRPEGRVMDSALVKAATGHGSSELGVRSSVLGDPVITNSELRTANYRL